MNKEQQENNLSELIEKIVLNKIGDIAKEVTEVADNFYKDRNIENNTDGIEKIYEAYNRGVSDGREDFELLFKRNGQLLQTLKNYENEIEQLKTQLQQANVGIVNCSGCYLVEANAAQTCVEKIFKEIYNRAAKNTFYDAWAGLNLEELAKQFGVEIDKISKDNEE